MNPDPLKEQLVLLKDALGIVKHYFDVILKRQRQVDLYLFKASLFRPCLTPNKTTKCI